MQTTFTDEAFQSFRRGDTRALGEMLNNLRPYVRIIVRSVGRGQNLSHTDESDLIQESLMQASRCSHTFHGATHAEWLGWLRTITVRTTGRLLQTRSHRALPAVDAAELGTLIMEPEVVPGARLIQQETADRMALVLARLPEEMQQVLLSRVVEGLDYETISGQMNRSSGAVRVLFVRALRQLRDVWQAEVSSGFGVRGE